jgi:hypothetical protein
MPLTIACRSTCRSRRGGCNSGRDEGSLIYALPQGGEAVGVLGYVQRGVAEQGADRGEPGVAGGDGVGRPVSRCWRNAVISG